MQTLIRPLAIIALLAASMVASAQTWPTKNVRVLVGAPPGGGTDIIARVLADITAKAPPDGHTLLVATTTGQAIAPHLMKLGYDPLKGLAPVALIATVPNVLVVNNDVPAKTVKELVALVKAAPDKYSYGSSGPGSCSRVR